MWRLELFDITKRYGPLLANDRISLKVAPGEVHGLLGENGAGKSTVMKIMCGSVRPDAGEIAWNGARIRMSGPHQARALGIAMVFQHFALFDSFTVAQNVWLGLHRRIPLATVRQRIDELGADYGVEIDPRRPTHTLTVGERQRVEILRAMLGGPKLLVLDEPTSVLDSRSVAQLFATLRRLAGEGSSIVYASHKLEEIRELCDRGTVLRAGRVIAEVVPSGETHATLSRLMLGAEPPIVSRAPRQAREVALAVRQLSLPRRDRFGVSLAAVDLTVRAGEIVGVAGVTGNGQAELLAAISGEDARGEPGAISLFGRDVTRAPPRSRRALGLRFVPDDRLGRATVPAMSLARNLLLTRSEAVGRGGLVRPGVLERIARRVMGRFSVKARGPDAAASSLSGGNLQRFIVGREIDARPRILVVSQPTWGVDVGAAAMLRGELVRLRDEGCAVLVVSAELDELFEISDTLVVMAQGRLSPPREPRELSVEQLGAWMSGSWPAGHASDAWRGKSAHAPP